MSIRYEHYDNEEREDERSDSGGHDREISLGTATVLGIFLALALVCALFFGFGYSMGRRSVPSALANVNTGISAPLPESKLTPGSLTSPRASYAPLAGSATTADSDSGAKGVTGSKTKPGAATVAMDAPADGVSQAAQRKQIAPAITQTADPKSLSPRGGAAETSNAAMPAITAGGTSYVQVAAISVTHKEDAEMLKGSLQRRGYAVAIHQGTQDQLLHIQIGPLASKKDAEAMKVRLLSDGYNAIVK
jgi:DedD protein